MCFLMLIGSEVRRERAGEGREREGKGLGCFPRLEHFKDLALVDDNNVQKRSSVI